jgi:TonB family protein
MRKYLLLIFILIIIAIGLILYLPHEKGIQTTETSPVQDFYQKDTIVIGDSISRAGGYQRLKYFYSVNKKFCFKYVAIYDLRSSSGGPEQCDGSLYKSMQNDKYYSIWRTYLSNHFFSPYNVLISNSGSYIVVFYPGFYHKTQNILDVYDSKGEIVRKFAVVDLITENRMDEIRIIEKNGMKHWGSGRLDEENDLVILMMPFKEELNYPVAYYTIAIDLKTGELVPLQEKAEPICIPGLEYPKAARKAGIEGTAVVKVLVDTTGSIIKAEILKSSDNEMLDEAALTAAKKTDFIPKQVKGKPVQDWTTISFKFKLNGQ